MISKLPAALSGWLAANLPGGRIAGELSGGFRNQNIAVVTDGGEKFVLRRYLRGNTCAVERDLAERAGRVVPVPGVVAADPDGVDAGEPVLLSRFAEGVVLDRVLTGPGPGEAEELGRRVGSVLAAIGSIRFPAPGFFAGSGLTPVPGGSETGDLVSFAASRAGDLRLDSRDRAALFALAERDQRVLDAVEPVARLVHADFNGKNLLVARKSGRWEVTAVLDWEFAYSGNPLADVGNVLRFPDDTGPAFGAAFAEAFLADSGPVPGGWREVSAALDLFALVDLLTLPDTHPLHAKVVAAVRARAESTCAL
ncbi:phosphotransferase family protein [Lentzea cavernae]|uniref:Aminoglycoside phosphotransferase domain-containing protein n=1 Tax=Lentzea cavernae TaxID=2020703 RepID=A0ABQ3MH10_9PSEU|nr:phosphotransferase [Lentzea cavernae]GHH40668.1 hypothetical protein GCM10017774_34410 [Lentzea cavernae]